MSVRFVIGRAGAGKTAHCLSAIQRSLTEAPVQGAALLLLVPEQAALQAERAVIADPRLGAAHRVTVTGFRRLAKRLVSLDAGPAAQVLSTNGRAMALRYLLAGLSESLQYYRRLERRKGFVEQLARSIGELIEEAISPDGLAAAITTAASGSPGADARVRKLADLHAIYTAYLSYLGESRLDPSQFLEVARRSVGRCPWLADSVVYVDGFAGFSRQEMLLLTEMATVARRIEVTAMIDPTTVTDLAGPPSADCADLFAKPLRTYLALHREFAEAGVELEEPLVLRPARSARFGAGNPLATLERRLFADTGKDLRQPSSGAAPADSTVELVSLPDRRVEVDYAVSRVCRWVQRAQQPLRYRDIALIVRDLEPYHDLLSAALAARNIPFFVDRRRPTAHHPLVELMRALVLMAADSMSIESVGLALKTGLTPLSDDAADELENFVLAHGVTGREAWTGDDWSPAANQERVGPLSEEQSVEPTPIDPASLRRLERINDARRALIGGVGEWLADAGTIDAADGRTWAVRLARALEAMEVRRQLDAWAGDAEDDGDLDAAEEHRQIWRDTCGFLDDLADALGGQVMDVRELAAVLEAGLSQFTLGLAPPMLDQVLVGGIERSRHPEIKAAVVLGFNDTAFPHAGQEDSILNDDDRTFLAETGWPVGTPRWQRVLEERLLVYVALTRASESVVVTYPVADEDGKALRVSPFAADIKAACPEIVERTVEHPANSRETWPLMSTRDLAAALPLEFRARPALQQDDAQKRAGWNAVYEAARTDEQLSRRVRESMVSLDYSNEARLAPESIGRLIGGRLEASVSRLECFAACAFRHFAQYGLRLREREVAVLEPVDLGKLHHAILEDFIDRLVESRRPLGLLDENQVLEHLRESCGRVGIRPPLGGELSDARELYISRRRGEDLAKVVRAQRKVAAGSAFVPRYTELPFGFATDDSLPALEIDTPAGRRVSLRGYIDRVDLAEHADELLGVVVDYKRTKNKRLDMSEVYHGLSLQLLAYLLALSRHGKTLAGRPVRPAAAFYVGLRPAYTALAHPSDYDAQKHSPLRAHRPRGLLDFGSVDALDTAYAGDSEHFAVKTKKDGAISNVKASDAAETATFDALLEHTLAKLGELADQILDGDISVSPYRLSDFSPCGWCPHRSVCRFEFGSPGLRFLQSLDRPQVFDRLASAAGEDAP